MDRRKGRGKVSERNMKIKRITYNDEANKELGEVIVEDVQSVFIERMDNGHIWMAIYPKDGERLVLNFYTKRNGMIEGHAELGA